MTGMLKGADTASGAKCYASEKEEQTLSVCLQYAFDLVMSGSRCRASRSVSDYILVKSEYHDR